MDSGLSTGVTVTILIGFLAIICAEELALAITGIRSAVLNHIMAALALLSGGSLLTAVALGKNVNGGVLAAFILLVVVWLVIKFWLKNVGPPRWGARRWPLW